MHEDVKSCRCVLSRLCLCCCSDAFLRYLLHFEEHQWRLSAKKLWFRFELLHLFVPYFLLAV